MSITEECIGLIPAAGKGVRLGLPYPKELYPVIRDNHYKPISQFVLNNLTEAGLEHIIFVINETKHQLVGFFGGGHRFGCKLSYVVQEPTLNDHGGYDYAAFQRICPSLRRRHGR
jgi:glucose-1-phosphate thymidylyltransferase